MSRKSVAKWCEWGIAGLVLAVLVYAALATGAVRIPDFLVLQGLTIGILVLWLVRLWFGDKPRLFWPLICWPVLGFTGYAIVRYLTADIEYVARQELMRVLVYASIFLAVVNNLQRPETLKMIIRVMVFVAMFVAGYAVYQYMTGDNRVWNFINPYEHRGSGTYINPNHLAGFLELILPMGLAVLLVGRSKQPVLIITMGYALLVIAAGLAVTFSRGGWISAAVALSAFFLIVMFHRRARWPAVVAVLVVVLLAGTFFSKNMYSKYRLARIFEGGEVHTELRVALWKPAIEMWEDHVWFGVGPAHYDYRFREYRPAEVQGRPDRAHNDYINTLADWGILGVLLVASSVGLLGVGAVRCWRGLNAGGNAGIERSDRLAVVLGGGCGILAILMHSLTDFNMQIPANALLAVTWMALMTGQIRYISNRAWVTNPFLVLGLVPAGALALTVYLGWQEQLRVREYHWLKKAASEEPNSLKQIEYMKRAFSVEPMNWETAYNIGELYRTRSWWRQADFETQAEEALEWFEKSMLLNTHDPYAPLRYGMCLDWLGRYDEAEPYFNRADALDPRGHYTAANVGWHYLQIRDLPAAQAWFERSLRLKWKDNKTSETYLEIIRERMLDAATNPLAVPIFLPNPKTAAKPESTQEASESANPGSPD